MEQRELTREEKTAIKDLVGRWCANYDPGWGCLPLACPCYMLEKTFTGAYCRYFQEALLPLDPKLAAALAAPGHTKELRPCSVCGRLFTQRGKRAYCSDACAEIARKKRQRGYMRKRRDGR